MWLDTDYRIDRFLLLQGSIVEWRQLFSRDRLSLKKGLSIVYRWSLGLFYVSTGFESETNCVETQGVCPRMRGTGECMETVETVVCRLVSW